MIFDLIMKQATGQCEVFEEDILFNNDDSGHDESDVEESEDSEGSPRNESESSAYEESPVKKKSKPLHEQFPDIKTIENILAFYKRYGLTKILACYKSLNNDHRKLKRPELYYEKEGTRISKLIELKAIVYQKFEEKRDKLASVHDVGLNRWAIVAADVVGLQDFKAEKTFITSSKKRSE